MNYTGMGSCSAVGDASTFFGNLYRPDAITEQQAQNLLAQQLMGQQQQQMAGMYAQASSRPPPVQVLRQQTTSASKPKGASMFTEVARDVKSFLLEHRSVIYFLAIALIVDHLFFKDAFRHRLQGMADKIVTKVEDKITA